MLWLLRNCLLGAERGSRGSQVVLNFFCDRVRATEDAPCRPLYLFKRVHGLTEMVKRGTVVLVEHIPVKPAHFEREHIILSEDAPRHGDHSARQCLGFFEAPTIFQ